MALRKCIHAYTPVDADHPPPYLSVNEEVDGSVSITVRSPAGDKDGEGKTMPQTLSYILMPVEEFADLIDKGAMWLLEEEHPDLVSELIPGDGTELGN